MDRDPEIDAVLVEQLAELGAVTAPFGGGAAVGAAWTARTLKTETARDMMSFAPALAESVVEALAAVLEAEPERADESSVVLVRGTVGSGFGGMNPAYVVASVDPTKATVGLAAYAKEGLIKQRTASKAVAKVLQALPQ